MPEKEGKNRGERENGEGLREGTEGEKDGLKVREEQKVRASNTGQNSKKEKWKKEV